VKLMVEVYVGAAIEGRSVAVMVEGNGNEQTVAFPISDLVLALVNAYSVPASGRLGDGGEEALVSAQEELVKGAQVLQSVIARDRALRGL